MIEEVNVALSEQVAEMLNEMGMPNIKALVVHNPRMKVKKWGQIGTLTIVDDALRFFASAPDLLIYIREDVFDRLSDDCQRIALLKILNGLHYDLPNDKLKIEREDVKEYSGTLNKYGVDLVINQYKLELSQALEKIEEES